MNIYIEEGKMKKQYGMFGSSEVDVDDAGFVEILVIVQESGLFAGAPPLEMRITERVPWNNEEFGKQWVAKLNRRTDLPFYLAKARVKVDAASLVQYTDKMLEKEGLEPIW